MGNNAQPKPEEKCPVRLKLRDDVLTALLFGEIDHHSAREIREEIDMTAMRVRPAQLVLDFGGVQFMDSSGVGLILGRCKLTQLWQGQIIVQNMPPKLERIVSMAGLTDLCTFRKEPVKDESDE
ncbi:MULTISPECIES: anti-sigma factor antagonist [Caproicibacterium]|uniref:Anti-sigma factor antagonist n=1 Tax=Caproicibacterium argilliputei TaxID=3030016 RepID=A0AA97D6Z9_9FIRM|nr:anti-sigma factor antagonist [Caproicibacterium argilliputei]WOC31489.1 anti-sigma factor antagonist [Caproicibacterium argilliputei]